MVMVVLSVVLVKLSKVLLIQIILWMPDLKLLIGILNYNPAAVFVDSTNKIFKLMVNIQTAILVKRIRVIKVLSHLS